MRFVVAWAATALLLVCSPGLSGQNSKPTDYQVKAAYLYNFGRFIEWPAPTDAGKSGSFMVCVLGHDPFGSILDKALAGETIAGKQVVARRLASPRESANCQILFLSADEEGQVQPILEDLDKEAVLTVSDIPNFSRRGGMIQFVLDGDRVRFEVNLTATQHAGLTLSSELLKVASAVRRSPGGGD